MKALLTITLNTNNHVHVNNKLFQLSYVHCLFEENQKLDKFHSIITSEDMDCFQVEITFINDIKDLISKALRVFTYLTFKCEHSHDIEFDDLINNFRNKASKTNNEEFLENKKIIIVHDLDSPKAINLAMIHSPSRKTKKRTIKKHN